MIDQRFGSYRVVRKIGEGGMGSVYEAVHDDIGKRVAIKVLHATYSREAEIRARFLSEARAVNLVQHPGLVSIFDYGCTANDAAYLIMEFLNGETLRARLKRQGKLPLKDLLRILRQVVDAVGAAHEKGIVHRDLKPENIMLIADRELVDGERIKILDFGVAKMTQPGGNAMTQAGAMLGTAEYMAPEQCLNAKAVDEKADIYALGVICYELLTGAVPFTAEGLGAIILKHLQEPARPLRELVPDVPEELAALVMRMLAKAPAERPLAREVAQLCDPLRSPYVSPQTVPMQSIPRSALPAQRAPEPAPVAFVQRGTAASTVLNYLYLDHPAVNADAAAVLLITACWNPGGQGGTYNNHHTGVWFAGNGRWSIYNEDLAPMPPTAAFNVLGTRAGFVHRAAAANTVNNWTLIDHPQCNGNKDALLLVTASWNPGGQGGTYNNHALGVWYTEGRWSIFNQDRARLPSGAAFNVLVAEQAFCHRVTTSNLLGQNATWIDHPAATGKPHAIVLVTPNWNPGGLGGLYHNHPIGVYYYGSRWAIFNQDMAPMPPGASFNVSCFSQVSSAPNAKPFTSSTGGPSPPSS